MRPDRTADAWLHQQLISAASSLHPRPERLGSDPRLRDALLALYGEEPQRFWGGRVKAFLERNNEALSILYEEHGVLGGTPLLDLVEAPLVLERLENDQARLAANWPLALSELVRLAAAAGTPIHDAA